MTDAELIAAIRKIVALWRASLATSSAGAMRDIEKLLKAAS